MTGTPAEPVPAAEPVLDVVPPADGRAPSAAVLVLHGGRERSHEAVEPQQLAVRRMAPFARDVGRRLPGVAVARLRYRVRGWNGDGHDVVNDVDDAVDRLTAEFGPVPLVLLGHSMGGRAAVRAAGAPTVRGVVALAPWLPDGEPVEQLAGRSLAVLHGTHDRTTSAKASARFVARARPVARDVACVRVARSGHGMILRAALWHRLAAEFVAALATGERLDGATTVARAAGCTGCAPGAS
jgi:pimeloyl-ACP methyl ester carboxylesterase